MHFLKVQLRIVISIFKSLRHPFQTTYVSMETGEILEEKD